VKEVKFAGVMVAVAGSHLFSCARDKSAILLSRRRLAQRGLASGARPDEGRSRT